MSIQNIYDTPTDMVINNVTIAPGEKKEVIISRCELPGKSTLEVPAYIYRSVNPGPTVLFSAGMHGEETNGIETLRQLLKILDTITPLKGTIVAVPVFNVVSFIFNQRHLPDGKDLNRSFPGSRGGSLGSRLAYDIMHTVLPVIDFGIDFHTGGASINNYPQLRFVFDDPNSMEIAQLFEPPFIINAQYREGSFRAEAAKAGKSILVFEAGESLRFNPIAIEEGLTGCLRLLNNLGMLPAVQPKGNPITIVRDKWLRADVSGLFRTHKKFGSSFEKGDILGTIGDPYNKSEHELIAPDNGYIIGLNNQPVVHAGDALLHLGFSG